MGTPITFWIALTNALLGGLVVGFVLLLTGGALWQAHAQRRKRRSYEDEIERDMREMFGAGAPEFSPPHAGDTLTSNRRTGSSVL